MSSTAPMVPSRLQALGFHALAYLGVQAMAELLAMQ
jgi:hypothetical protein